MFRKRNSKEYELFKKIKEWQFLLHTMFINIEIPNESKKVLFAWQVYNTMALPMSKIVMNLKTESSHYEKKNVFNYHRVLPFSI